MSSGPLYFVLCPECGFKTEPGLWKAMVDAGREHRAYYGHRVFSVSESFRTFAAAPVSTEPAE